MTDTIGAYLDRYGCDRRWSLAGTPSGKVRTAVVIPALAESAHLFRTLESISRNDAHSLAETMVICVVNNGIPGIVRVHDRRDNEMTLAILRRVLKKNTRPDDAGGHATAVAASGLSVGYIDASSPGRELPTGGGGVGLARKIGMDRALELFDHRSASPNILLCLDGDTLVDGDWLAVVRRNFERRGLTAAAVEFAHQRGGTADDDDAICLYETFIRYYRLGLEYARSPYAWHAIGSTMAVTAGGYAAVRGMSRRQAGEDFHFLNKVTKAGPVGLVTDTRVYPSSRRSHRVPFGTGRAVSRFLSQGSRLGTAWDPEVFHLVKEWTACLGEHSSADAEELLQRARGIHSLLPDFLHREGFQRAWPRLLKNAGKTGVTKKQFSGWFDALKTYKMIRYMSIHGFTPLPLYAALKQILALQGRELTMLASSGTSMPGRENRRAILEELARMLPSANGNGPGSPIPKAIIAPPSGN